MMREFVLARNIPRSSKTFRGRGEDGEGGGWRKREVVSGVGERTHHSCFLLLSLSITQLADAAVLFTYIGSMSDTERRRESHQMRKKRQVA